MIKSALPTAKNDDRLWLYSMQVKGHLKIFEQDRSSSNVRRAVAAAKNLNKKNAEPLPAFAQFELDNLRSFFIDFSDRYSIQNSHVQKVIKECIDPICEIFPDKDMAWHIYRFLAKDDLELALNILANAVQKNYQARLIGDTTDFYYGYLPLMNYYASRVRFSSFFTMYKMARQAYPAKTSLCSDVTGIVQKTAETLGLNQSNTQEIIFGMIDSMKQAGCNVLPLQLSLKKEIFRYYCEVSPNFKEALTTAVKLSQMAPDSCGTAFFRKTFSQNLIQDFTRADSIRWAVWMRIAGYKNEAAMFKNNEVLFYEMLGMNLNIPCYSFQQFLKKRFPAEKKLLNKMAEALSKSMGGQLDKIATGKSGLAAIIAYYHANSELPETRELTIAKLLKLGNDMRGAGNFSSCMRISKESLRLFPGEKRLLDEKMRWMLADYNTNYLSLSKEFSAEITGFDPSRCKEGFVTDNYQRKFLQVLDVVRRFAGLNDSTELSPKKNNDCQKAALIMDANNRLTHHPGKSMKCYSDDGLSAASTSNLSLGHNGINALFGQLDDWGANNYFVGHRRWILNPKNHCFGHGSTNRSMALGVFGMGDFKAKNNQGKNAFVDSTDFVAWPTADYFPVKWLPMRWSFGFIGGMFEKSKVTVMQNGVKIPLKINKLEYYYSINTLVWEIDPDNLKTDVPIVVKITDVQVGNKNRDFYYQVTLF